MASQNIDPAEVDKFSSAAAHWWELEGEFKTLHQLNPLRLQYINEKASLAGKNVIDIGCGGGILSESMAKLGARVTGIDVSRAALEVAKLHQFESHVEVEYLEKTAEEIALLRPQQYDVVTCLELLEHVPDPVSIVEACSQLVKPEGHIFFSTLNRNLKSYLFAIIGAEYFLKLLPLHTHDFAKFIRPSELSQWAITSGLTVKEIIGIQYNILTKKFSLTEDVAVNYLTHLRKV